MKRIFYTALFIILFNLCKAQENDFARRPDAVVFKEVSTLGWVKFQDNYKTEPEKVFELNKKSFGLGENFHMKITRTRDDEYGYRHIKFQQTYRDINVLGGEYLIHAKNGKAFTGNGKIFSPEPIEIKQSISEQAALNAALRHINASSYYWQNAKRESKLKIKTRNPSATYFPKAEMIYVPSSDKNVLLLCYSFVIQTNEFGKSAICYIDASNGLMIKKTPLDYSCDRTTIVTNWNGSRLLFTNHEDDHFDLEDDCQESVYGVYDVTNDDDIFNSPNNVWIGNKHRSAATSLWAIKECYVWYRDFFGREGHDHDDGDLDIYQGFDFEGDLGNNNASYHYDRLGDDEIKIGTGDSPSIFDDYNALDILAHEYTHGVTRYEADLDYEKESGALNESFSDILGEWVESKVLGGNNNWLIGWDRVVGSCNQPLRSLVDPAAQGVPIGGNCTMNFTQPNRYKAKKYWIDVDGCDPGETNDQCWVHTNSGVQNQVFYLLSVGGNGWTNDSTCHAPVDSGYPWSVAGIGIDKAARIAYKVLNDFLTSTSGYLDVRNAWVHAAENIFGTCSFEAIQTGKAWHAVGIGPPAVQQTLPLCNATFGAMPYTINTPANIVTIYNCPVTILNTGNQVNFISGGRIVLNPGFASLNGSKFRAAIATDCWFATY